MLARTSDNTTVDGAPAKRISVIREGSGSLVLGSRRRAHQAGAAVTFSQPKGIYVHAKCMMIDDLFVSIGSANLNRRGFFHDGELNVFAIPEELRPLIGNRIYGCDDCQLACPWNRFARRTVETDFAVRHGLDSASLVELFAWTEAEFKSRLAGSAIYRIGHERWLRNIAVALGNAPGSPEVIAALASRRDHPSELVREHVAWALGRHRA